MHPLTMKFGGTSVADADAIGRLIGHVRDAHRVERGVMVIVSAMAGVTDCLLSLASAAAAGNATAVRIDVDSLKSRHLDAATQVAPGRFDELRGHVDAQLEDLRIILQAVMTLREASPRALDTVAACGEMLSSRIVAAALDEAGVASRWLDPRGIVITDAQFTSASPLLDDIAAAVGREVEPLLSSGVVPVIGGFVGGTAEGATTTLGRGGSDYSAALVGAALHAREIQIWTDVDGMLTADPRVVPSARIVPRLSFAEASELAYFGAKVLHPSTILPAVARDIPVRILNSRAVPGTLAGADTGTLIASALDAGRPLAALACKRNVTVVDVTSTRMLQAFGFLRRLFEVFERHRTSVDVVTTSEVSVSITLDDDRHIAQIASDVSAFGEVKVERGMAILCAVGDGLRDDAHLATAMLGALDGFALRMVSQAASRRNLTVVVRDSDVPAAMNRLHERFVLATGSHAVAVEQV
jgi:aspartate kinase